MPDSDLAGASGESALPSGMESGEEEARPRWGCESAEDDSVSAERRRRHEYLANRGPQTAGELMLQYALR